MARSSSSGSFIATTPQLDVSEINREADIKSLMTRVYLVLNTMSMAINLKDTGYYSKEEFVCGRLFYPSGDNNSNTSNYLQYRPVFRLVLDCGALPNATTKLIPHGLNTTGYTLTKLSGSATNTSRWGAIPLPYLAGIGTSVAVWMDGTNINIQTSGNMSSYNKSSVVIEYVKT